MIRIVNGKTSSGYRVMELVEVPTRDIAVAERLAMAWAEAAGWTEVVVRTPKEKDHLNQRINQVPDVEYLEKMLAAWKGGAR